MKFKRDGYVAFCSGSPRPFLANDTDKQWVDTTDEAHIFSELGQAIASCKHWAYFAATTGIEVIEVKAGKHLFEDGGTVYRED
jgi:hypothetical protein